MSSSKAWASCSLSILSKVLASGNVRGRKRRIHRIAIEQEAVFQGAEPNIAAEQFRPWLWVGRFRPAQKKGRSVELAAVIGSAHAEQERQRRNRSIRMTNRRIAAAVLQDEAHAGRRVHAAIGGSVAEDAAKRSIRFSAGVQRSAGEPGVTHRPEVGGVPAFAGAQGKGRIRESVLRLSQRRDRPAGWEGVHAHRAALPPARRLPAAERWGSMPCSSTRRNTISQRLASEVSGFNMAGVPGHSSVTVAQMVMRKACRVKHFSALPPKLPKGGKPIRASRNSFGRRKQCSERLARPSLVRRGPSPALRHDPCANPTLDPVTGFLSRTAGLQAAAVLMADVGARQARLCAIWLDIDRFRQVNESFGHAAGDGVIARIAERIRSAIGLPCALLRMGGDEFVVLAAVRDRSAATQLARQLLVEIRRPLTSTNS
jgi:hypothetical protein